MKTHSSKSQNLPFKLLVLSYLTHVQKTNTFTDCYNAINSSINKLSSNIESNYTEILEIVGPSESLQNNQMMETIY